MNEIQEIIFSYKNLFFYHFFKEGESLYIYSYCMVLTLKNYSSHISPCQIESSIQIQLKHLKFTYFKIILCLYRKSKINKMSIYVNLLTLDLLSVILFSLKCFILNIALQIHPSTNIAYVMFISLNCKQQPIDIHVNRVRYIYVYILWG